MQHIGILGIGQQFFQLGGILAETGANQGFNLFDQCGVTFQQPAAEGDAVGLVVELFRVQLVEAVLLSGDNDYTTNQQDVAIVGLSSRPKLSCSISVLSGSKPIIGYTTDGGLHTIWMRRYPWRSFFSIKTLVKDNANIDINKMSYDEPNGIIYF